MNAATASRIPVAGFLALIGAAGLLQLGQWLVYKVGSGTPVDIGEWPFVGIGALLVVLPIGAAVGLVLHRGWGTRFGRVAAGLAALVGAALLMTGFMFLSMGVAWNLLVGGVVLLVGGIASLFVLWRT